MVIRKKVVRSEIRHHASKPGQASPFDGDDDGDPEGDDDLRSYEVYMCQLMRKAARSAVISM